jgi:hypothetical protein
VARRSGRTLPRPWKPLERATPVITPQLREQAEKDPEVARLLEESREVWLNDQYVVTVRRFAEGDVASLSIRRDDRKAPRDWRHFQWIKNEIAGTDVEAVELFPAEDRLVDTANQFWLWCAPPGQRFPFGFQVRAVSDEPDPKYPKSEQRAFSS